MRFGAALILAWLIVGAIAAGQRGYFGGSNASCTTVGSAALTVVAGPLNYFGVNPKTTCKTPQPSR